MIPLLGPDVSVVTASPYHPQGRVKNVPSWRLGLSRGASFLYRRVFRQQLHTYTSCFRVYRRSALQGLEIDEGGFLGVAEMLGRLDLKGAQDRGAPGRSRSQDLRSVENESREGGSRASEAHGPPLVAAVPQLVPPSRARRRNTTRSQAKEWGMNQTRVVEEITMQLPSDQDSTGRTLGEEEILALTQAIRTGTLTSTKGQFVKRLEEGFARHLGAEHASACASGTAAVHLAVAAIDPEPGDEIVTTSITDMGALSPILYQGAIPVFVDVDPRTCNVTAETIEAGLSPRTRAIVVTHLFGNPCDMGPILDLAARRGLPVIEDCAQAFGARYDGRHVGTLGTDRRVQPPAGQAHHHGGRGPGRVQRRGSRPPDVPLHQQGVGLRRRQTRSLLPGPQLPDERAPGRRRVARSFRSSHPWSRGAWRPPGASRSSSREFPGSTRPSCIRKRSTPTGSTALMIDPAVIDGGARGHRPHPEGGRDRIGAALHPEAGLPVRGLREAADIRREPLAFHPGAARGRRLRRGPIPGNLHGPGAGSSCSPGTSATPTSTSTTSRRSVRSAAARLSKGECPVSNAPSLRHRRRRRHRPDPTLRRSTAAGASGSPRWPTFGWKPRRPWPRSAGPSPSSRTRRCARRRASTRSSCARRPPSTPRSAPTSSRGRSPSSARSP